MLPLRGVVIFRQLQCQQSQTFTYLLGCSKTREAILVDSCLGNVERDSALAQELDLKVCWDAGLGRWRLTLFADHDDT